MNAARFLPLTDSLDQCLSDEILSNGFPLSLSELQLSKVFEIVIFQNLKTRQVRTQIYQLHRAAHDPAAGPAAVHTPGCYTLPGFRKIASQLRLMESGNVGIFTYFAYSHLMLILTLNSRDRSKYDAHTNCWRPRRASQGW